MSLSQLFLLLHLHHRSLCPRCNNSNSAVGTSRDRCSHRWDLTNNKTNRTIISTSSSNSMGMGASRTIGAITTTNSTTSQTTIMALTTNKAKANNTSLKTQCHRYLNLKWLLLSTNSQSIILNHLCQEPILILLLHSR